MLLTSTGTNCRLWSGWPWNRFGWNWFRLAFERVQFKLFSWAVWKIGSLAIMWSNWRAFTIYRYCWTRTSHPLGNTVLITLSIVHCYGHQRWKSSLVYPSCFLASALLIRLLRSSAHLCRAARVHRRVSTPGKNVRVLRQKGRKCFPLIDANGCGVCKDKCGHEDS